MKKTILIAISILCIAQSSFSAKKTNRLTEIKNEYSKMFAPKDPIFPDVLKKLSSPSYKNKRKKALKALQAIQEQRTLNQEKKVAKNF